MISMGERKIGLVGTIISSIVALIGVSTALLLFDPRTTGAEALRTGGLAAGSVVALYALWLNDRRRRVEETRQGFERRRTDYEGDRAADERFARAVELLGNEADQVRVGALHALAGLARTSPSYTQTVLDILCAYLRQPFLHPRYQTDEAEWTQAETNDAERKLQVRLTAQRLIADLLPHTGEADAPRYDLDLTGASLEYFDPSGRQIGWLVMRYARLYSRNNFSNVEVHGPAWFTEMSTATGRLSGRFFCTDAVFHERAWFSGVSFQDQVDLARSTFHGAVKFRDSSFSGTFSADQAVFHADVDLGGTTFIGDVYLRTARIPNTASTAGMNVDSARHVELPQHWSAAEGLTDTFVHSG